MKWMESDDMPERTDFSVVLAEVEAAQPEYPGMWAEVRRYAKPTTAYDRAAKLKAKWPNFSFRTATDPDTGEGILWAQYTGGDDDRDILDADD